MPLHPHNLRWLAEDLVRRRRADDRDRFAASQRQARIDPNPHQIDAVIFALRRLEEGGCILADEVGLGKTIEAGLVIAQGRAEGRQRVLLVVPKPLLGQWQSELFALFALEARELTGATRGPGIWIIGREAAGSERGSAWVRAEPFDLCVIDEAHETFASIYKRYRSDGSYDEDGEHALTAHRVREAIGTAPVLLLTATPIQNSLVELWGLAQYVEPTRTLFGDLPTFRQVFCAGDDRVLVTGQEPELQRRIATICKRTLRRQAQEFLDRPFVDRTCRLFEYAMRDDERALYDDVTEYLMRPVLHAFEGRSRKLLLIGFHRRMASSNAALAASLVGVANRLRGLLAGQPIEAIDRDLAADLDDEDDDLAIESDPSEEASATDPLRLEQELELVEGFVLRAKALPSDAKAIAFRQAIQLVLDRGSQGSGSGKAVVFTESLTTQAYIRDVLLDMGLADGDVTLFRGKNDGLRAKEALARWLTEEGPRLQVLPSRDIQVRMALVHEFRTRSKVIVCTEAGAKGLNLQFCETVINYDLPWNPQRIEQRIGRCHRYGQTRSVLVVNFLAKDNEAHRLTFEILSQKLDLFGRVLDASDNVLHEPTTDSPEPIAGALSADFESELRRIYDRARTNDDVKRDIAALRDTLAERRASYEAQQRRTAALIESRFDQDVRRVFRGLNAELSAGLARLDRDLAEVVAGYLAMQGLDVQRTDDGTRVLLHAKGRVYATGSAKGLVGAEALNLAHPIVLEALAAARSWAGGSVEFDPPDPALSGRIGVLTVAKVSYGGFEPVDRLVAAAVIDGAPVDPHVALRIAQMPARDGYQLAIPFDDDALAEAVEEAVYVDQRNIEAAEQAHFERAIGQLERFVEDRALVCRQERAASARTLERATKRRDDAMGSDARARAQAEMADTTARIAALDQRITQLEARQDEDYQRWRRHHHEKRYQAPTIARLFTVTFRLGPTETSC